MVLLFLIFALFFASCSEVGDGPSPNNSSGSDPDPISSSSLSSSSSSSSSFEIEWVDMGNEVLQISKNVLSTESITWHDAMEIAKNLKTIYLEARLPTPGEWQEAVAEGIIEQYSVFDEWTNTCTDDTCNMVIRKNFNKPLEDILTYPEENHNIAITFRIVRYK